MWKTLIGKNHGSPQTPNYSLWDAIQWDSHLQQPPVRLLRLQAVTTKMLRFSLSLSLFHILHSMLHRKQLYKITSMNHNINFCPSYIYTHITLGIFTNITSIRASEHIYKYFFLFQFTSNPAGYLPHRVRLRIHLIRLVLFPSGFLLRASLSNLSFSHTKGPIFPTFVMIRHAHSCRIVNKCDEVGGTTERLMWHWATDVQMDQIEGCRFSWLSTRVWGSCLFVVLAMLAKQMVVEG